MVWGVTYFDQIILSMSSLQTTYHNIRVANCVRSHPLESHEVLEKEFVSNPKVKSMHKAIRQYMHMVAVICLDTRCTDCQLSIASLCFSRICQVIFRTGQAHLCQDNIHISSRDATA